MADTKVKTRLDIEKEKAREKAQRDVARLNKRAIDVLNDENPELIEAVFAALDAEDAVEGKREDKLANAVVKSKRDIVASFAIPTTTPSHVPMYTQTSGHDGNNDA